MEGLFQALVNMLAVVLISNTPVATDIDATQSKLVGFLSAKGSPLPAEELVKYPNWPMIVALSAAESGYGRYLAGNFNAWGIKDFRGGSRNFGGNRHFTSWEESVEFTSELLYAYDSEDGMPNPKAMVRRWKYVLPYQHWVENVNYALNDLEVKVLS